MKNFILSSYSSEDTLLVALRNLKKEKIPVHDVFMPYPIHEVESLMGIRRSRLPIVCFVACMIGFAIAMGFQMWVFNLDWPIIVGGKPHNSVPAFIPVAFEMTVLVGGLVTVVAFFIRSRLTFGKKLKLDYQNISDDSFVVAVEHSDASLDEKEVAKILEESGATIIEEKELML